MSEDITGKIIAIAAGVATVGILASKPSTQSATSNYPVAPPSPGNMANADYPLTTVAPQPTSYYGNAPQPPSITQPPTTASNWMNQTQAQINTALSQGNTTQAVATYLQAAGQLISGQATTPVGTGISVGVPSNTAAAGQLAAAASAVTSLQAQGLSETAAEQVVYAGAVPITYTVTQNSNGAVVYQNSTTVGSSSQAAIEQFVSSYNTNLYTVTTS